MPAEFWKKGLTSALTLGKVVQDGGVQHGVGAPNVGQDGGQLVGDELQQGGESRARVGWMAHSSIGAKAKVGQYLLNCLSNPLYRPHRLAHQERTSGRMQAHGQGSPGSANQSGKTCKARSRTILRR